MIHDDENENGEAANAALASLDPEEVARSLTERPKETPPDGEDQDQGERGSR